jgi:hypothetical protein
MKNMKSYYSITALITILLIAVSCERKLDGLELATYPTTPEVYIDGFSSGLYYAAYGTSKVTAFSVDNNVKYKGTSSMKFAVPDTSDPNGSYVGGVFGTNPARDLSGYNVLTFWAKASQPATLNEVGFANDMGESKYKVTLTNVNLNTNWMQYYVPFPDPSVLKQERGMFFYAAGPQNGRGYTIWIDEVKFEKLGTIAHEVFRICNGTDLSVSGLPGTYTIPNINAAYNLPTGIDQTETIATSYFTFISSDTSIATVNSSGVVTLKANGSAKITAKVGNTDAIGSYTIATAGPTSPAPTPAVPAVDAISVFSNAYTNIKVDSYDPYWAPYMTTNYATFKINGDDLIRYSNFNDTYNEKKVYVAITFETNPIDISAMKYMHIDIWIPDTSPNPNNKFTIKLEDFGANGTYGGGDDSEGVYNNPSALAPNKWVSVEIPMSSFAGFKNKAHVAQMILDNFPTDMYVDNIYFHK